jgi:hypothetical protein
MGKKSIAQNAQESKAEETVLALAERHGLTVGQVSTQIMYDLCNGVPDLATADRLTELFWASERILNGNCDLIADQAPEPQSLPAPQDVLWRLFDGVCYAVENGAGVDQLEGLFCEAEAQLVTGGIV